MPARFWSNRNAHSLPVEMQNDTLWKTVWQFLIKLNILLPYNPPIMLTGICSNEWKTYPHKNLHLNVYSTFIHNYQNLEAIKMSFNKWMDKQIMIQPHNRIWFGAKKKWAIKPQKDMEETYYKSTILQFKKQKRNGGNLNA